MPASLPRQPSLEHLRKSAKRLLAAQRRGDPRCCHLLRELHRFADASDAEILSSRVTLRETQLLVALHYGFTSWAQLRRQVEAERTTNANGLGAVERRCSNEVPDYVKAGVPLAVVAALNHAGIDIDFVQYVAATGWAFSFGYRYDDISPAFLAVRGRPNHDGPPEVFAFLPTSLGFGYEWAVTDDPEALWRFVVRHVDAGTPIMSEHLDGGLITGYQEVGGRRQLYFDGSVGAGWIGADGLQPHAVYVLVRERDPLPWPDITRRALGRAARMGGAHSWQGVPQGLAALRAYRADIADPARTFADTSEWLGWATFERLLARRCCELWLREVAEQVPGPAAEPVRAAAKHYGEAFGLYDRFRAEVEDGVAPGSRGDRARTPERIAIIAPLLERGIAAEVRALDELGRAAALTEGARPKGQGR